MNNPTFTVDALIQSLQAYPKDLPVYIESANGNTIPWTGQISQVTEESVSVMGGEGMAAKIHAL